jgi:signal peptidase I
LIQAFVVKPYKIPTPSMVPTLETGQRVLVNRFSYRFGGDPTVGDVVVFHPPIGADAAQCGIDHPADSPCPDPGPVMSEENYIKRVVAGPGDTVRIVDGVPIVNGVRPPTEDYIEPCAPEADCDFPEPITVPADHYFMMGDNRGASDDSRYWGPVPRDWLIGEAFATYWPPDRVGIL